MAISIKCALLLIIFSFFQSHLAFAEDDPEDDDEFEFNYVYDPEEVNNLARSDVQIRLEPLGFGLMGDKIDPFTGTIVFNQTDVSIPGNSKLEVAIRRIASTAAMTNQQEGYFGDWILDIPNVSSLSPTYENFLTCVGDTYDEIEAYGYSESAGRSSGISASLWWDGLKLNIPGQGGKLLLENYPSFVPPSRRFNFFDQTIWKPFYSNGHESFSENAVGRITKDHWVVTCINPHYSIRNNAEALNVDFDGYVAISPDGTRYRMDKLVVKRANDFRTRKEISQGRFLFTVQRNIARYYATEVTDVHGNWVKYEFDSEDRLERIHSNDGREITLTYHANSQRIATITANPNDSNSARTWTYIYRDLENSGISRKIENALYQVVQPDGKYWEYNFDFQLLSDPSTDSKRRPSSSDNKPLTYLNNYVIHPYGVRADYDVGRVVQGRSDHGHIAYVSQYSYSRTISVFAKHLTGPSIPTSTWQYEYEGYQYGQDFLHPNTKTTTLTNPSGHKTVSHYFRKTEREMLGGPLVGKLDKKERFDSSGNLLERSTYEYLVGDPMGNIQVFYHPDFTNEEFLTRFVHVYTTKEVTQRNGDTFTKEYVYNTDQNSTSYSYHQPIITRTYSNISTTPRSTVFTYEHKKDNWILNLPKTVTVNGRRITENGYDSLGRKTWINQYGHRMADFYYHSHPEFPGQLYAYRDANGKMTYANFYYRGIPGVVERPDGSQDEVEVDANGWTMGRKDYNGYWTRYQRDSMGRVTKIMPSKTQKNWLDTNITYDFADEITQTITRGDKQEVVTYDNFQRVIQEKLNDLSGKSQTTFVKTEYNEAGQEIFKSFPSFNAHPTTGTEKEYDGLGRLIAVQENVYPYAKTSYDFLGGEINGAFRGHRNTVTDAAGETTTYYRDGYSGPGKGKLMGIEQPLDVNTIMYRNSWGQLTRLRQYGTQNGVSMDKSQYYTYNSQQRLCRHFTSEGGASLYQYDAVGNMVAYERGSSHSSCATPSGIGRVDLELDDLYRVTTTNFADPATPDIHTSYDANGNILTVDRDGANWTYIYDELNHLISEQLDIDGKNFDLAYEYNEAEHLVQTTLPTGRTVFSELDGLGREVSVRSRSLLETVDTTFAHGIRYHANNITSQIDYGNNTRIYQRINQRQMISSADLTFFYPDEEVGLIEFGYKYDERGNMTSRNIGGPETNMEYDALGRLIKADGGWGEGSYTYDALGNLRQKVLGSRTVNVNYDNARNLPTSNTDTTNGSRTIEHDHRGNVTRLGDLDFIYDYSNQPVQISGSSNGSYKYDGNLKRVKSVVDGKVIYNIYNAAGSLVHVDADTDNKITEYIGSFARITNNVVTYIHSDHLGTPIAGTDASGNVIWREDYTPFGEKYKRNAANDDLGGYTGHVYDSSTGLNYMQARYQDPVIGRFLSIDPVGFSPGKPYMFNRYAYVGNNPVGRIDPFGMDDNSVGDGADEEDPPKPPPEEVNVTATKWTWPKADADLTWQNLWEWSESPRFDGEPNESDVAYSLLAGAGFAVLALHGNSNSNPNPTHRYVIVDGQGNILKTGISSAPLNKNGTSRRANSQLSKLDSRLNAKAVVVESNISRRAAKQGELNVVNKTVERRNAMPLMMKRPIPTRRGGGAGPIDIFNM